MCAGCNAFKADVLNVATAGGPVALCWICRHDVVVHGIRVERLMDVPPERSSYRDADGNLRRRLDEYGKVCMHTRAGIYPADVLKARDEYAAAKREQMYAQFAVQYDLALSEVVALARSAHERQVAELAAEHAAAEAARAAMEMAA